MKTIKLRLVGLVPAIILSTIVGCPIGCSATTTLSKVTMTIESETDPVKRELIGLNFPILNDVASWIQGLFAPKPPEAEGDTGVEAGEPTGD